MKKMICMLLIACFAWSLAAYGSEDDSPAEGTAENAVVTDGTGVHKIGVLVYNRTDEEVLTFKDYLENYIAGCFEDVEFLYSDNITNTEEELGFIDAAAENGVEGIMSFITYDLEAEVELCAEYGIYYMLASGSVSVDLFDKVADNEYFLGIVGPGGDIEYQAGVDMAEYFVENGESDAYFILSGGGYMGNEMHKLRTKGMLDTLQEAYGVTFEESPEDMAASEEAVHVEDGGLTVCVYPGYLSREEHLEAIRQEYEAGQYGVVMGAMAVLDFQEDVAASGAKLGMVDCYSGENWNLFTHGQLDYLTGKYQSIIGPSFAAMYNALNGYAAEFREADGTAFKVIQGFWTSDSAEDFEEKYTLSSSIAVNAYNYEDLYSVCKNFNPDATLQDLKELAGAYTFEEAQARRAE